MNHENQSPSNKRRGERVARHFIIRIQQIFSGTSSDYWDVSTIRNISEAGVLFYSADHYKAGIEVIIRMRNPLDTEIKEVSCHGIVVRCTLSHDIKNIYEIAVDFTKIPEESKKTIYEIVNYFLKKEKKHHQ